MKARDQEWAQGEAGTAEPTHHAVPPHSAPGTPEWWDALGGSLGTETSEKKCIHLVTPEDRQGEEGSLTSFQGIPPTLHSGHVHLFDTYYVRKIVLDCRYAAAIKKCKVPAGTELTV